MGIPFPDRRSLVLAIALVIGVVSLAGRVAAADLAIVDYQAVFEKYEGTSDAQRTLDREMKDWDAQAKEMRSEIENMTNELESQRLMLSEDRLREKTEELDRLREEYQTFAEDVWGVEGRAELWQNVQPIRPGRLPTDTNKPAAVFDVGTRRLPGARIPGMKGRPTRSAHTKGLML